MPVVEELHTWSIPLSKVASIDIWLQKPKKWIEWDIVFNDSKFNNFMVLAAIKVDTGESVEDFFSNFEWEVWDLFDWTEARALVFSPKSA